MAGGCRVVAADTSGAHAGLPAHTPASYYPPPAVASRPHHIRELGANGWAAEKIARVTGTPLRTVQRILRETRLHPPQTKAVDPPAAETLRMPREEILELAKHYAAETALTQDERATALDYLRRLEDMTDDQWATLDELDDAARAHALKGMLYD